MSNEQVPPIFADYLNNISKTPVVCNRCGRILTKTEYDNGVCNGCTKVDYLPSEPDPDEVNDRRKEDKLIEEAEDMRHDSRDDMQREIEAEHRRDQRVSINKLNRTELKGV